MKAPRRSPVKGHVPSAGGGRIHRSGTRPTRAATGSPRASGDGAVLVIIILVLVVSHRKSSGRLKLLMVPHNVLQFLVLAVGD